MDTKTGTEKVGGVFDFGAAPQAEKDEQAAVEADTTSNATETETKAPTTQTEDTTVDQDDPETTDETQTEENKTDKTVVTEEPFEVNGRTFTTRDELVTAYSNSSAEGIRLAKANEEYLHKVNELNKKLLELEDKQGEAPFPGLLSSDKEQEAAQLEMLPTYRQTEYIINKKAWEDKQATLKVEREQRKAQLVENETHIKDVITRAEKDMESEPTKYPGFSDLKPTMAKIIELTPSIANRPETPYLAFWIAYGLNAFGKEDAVTSKTKQTVNKATEAAKLAHAQIGKGGVGKPAITPANGSDSSVVSAWRNRNGTGL